MSSTKWTLSTTAESIATPLVKRVGALGLFTPTTTIESVLDAMDKLVETEEPAAMSSMVRCLLCSSEVVRKHARIGITELLQRVRMADMSDLGVLFHSYTWHYQEDWHRLTPSDVSRIAGEANEFGHTAVLAILSFHYSGFVRQEALRQLSRCTDGSEVPFIVVRLNDWVDQVATLARDVFERRITRSYLSHLVRSLPLIVRLDRMSRRDHKNIVVRAVRLLLDDEQAHLLALDSEDGEARRFVAHCGLQLGGEIRLRTVRHGTNSADPVVRFLCCPYVSDVLTESEATLLLTKLSIDSYMPLRREATSRLAAAALDGSDAIWMRTLFDRSQPMRELAQVTLRSTGRCNLADLYREKILESPDSLPALQGLAECGDQSDLPIFRGLLDHRLPSRRVVAIRGIARTLMDQGVDSLLEALTDSSPAVLRELRKSLRLMTSSIPGETLVNVAVGPFSPASQSNAIQMVFDRGKWESLPLLLRVVSEGASDAADLAIRFIEKWMSPAMCNRVFTRPSPTQSSAIRQAMEEAKRRIPPVVISAIERDLQGV